jgi:anaphase-promoting complex subunit 7
MILKGGASCLIFLGSLGLTKISVQAFTVNIGKDGYHSTCSGRFPDMKKTSSTSLCMSIPTFLDTLTSGLASICRLPNGVSVDVDAIDIDRRASRGEYFAVVPKQPYSEQPRARLVELYDVENHRECRKVRERITELDLVVEQVIPAAKNSRVFTDPHCRITLMPGILVSYEDIPILVAIEPDGRRVTFMGAKNIVAYLEATFASPTSPKQTVQQKFLAQTIDVVREGGNVAACVLRTGRGTGACSAARVSTDWTTRVPRPVTPLILYSYEGNQFCRLVREVLTELDIVYELRSAGKGSSRRLNELAKISGGSTQCPYLVDPNTITTMPESADIIRYLYSRYASWTPPNEVLRWISDNLLPLARPFFHILTPIQAGGPRLGGDAKEENGSLFEIEMAKTRHAVEATVGANPVVIFTYEWNHRG